MSQQQPVTSDDTIRDTADAEHQIQHPEGTLILERFNDPEKNIEHMLEWAREDALYLKREYIDQDKEFTLLLAANGGTLPTLLAIIELGKLGVNLEALNIVVYDHGEVHGKIKGDVIVLEDMIDKGNTLSDLKRDFPNNSIVLRPWTNKPATKNQFPNIEVKTTLEDLWILCCFGLNSDWTKELKKTNQLLAAKIKVAERLASIPLAGDFEEFEDPKSLVMNNPEKYLAFLESISILNSKQLHNLKSLEELMLKVELLESSKVKEKYNIIMRYLNLMLKSEG